MNVAVNPIYEIEEYITICENESYTWLGHKSDTIISNLTAGDNRTPKDYIYVDSLLTVGGLGCDSVHILHLTVSPINEVEVYDTLCDNEIYLFHEGESYERELSFDVSVATAYTIVDTLINTHGCDSIVTLFLTVAPSYLIEQDTIICEGDILNWRGKIFQDLAAGTCEIYDNYQTVTYGCDSVYKLNVVVHPSYEIEEYVYMCEGDSYTWIGHKGDTIIGNLSIGDGNLSQEYIFIDSLQTTVGCDSIHILHLSVNPTYYVFAETSICDNESYNFNGRILSDVAGVYTVFDTLQTIYGCDSVVELTLTVHPTYLFDTTAVICSNEIITYRGIDYRTEGVYDDSLHTIYGCDSIYRLNLIVIPAYEFEYNITICDTESFYWRNQNLNTFKGEFPTGLNIISQKYYTDAGCDSVYKLNLTINPTYFFEDSITICSNETYDFRGKILTQEGVYYDSLLTTLGCDSVYQFTLYHNPAYSFVIYDTICSNETYDFRGVIVNQEGVYYDSLTTVLDCDSVYELRLTVMPTYFFDLEEHICDYETYNFNGLELAEEGFYIDSLYSIYGCDSVYHLNLFVHPSTVDTIYDTICVEGKYYFGDRYLTEPGYYLDTTLNEFNCRHIDHLFLSQIEPAKITFEVDDFCADDLFFELRFSYDGYAPVSYSIKYDDIGKDVGFEDNIDILLEDTVIQIPIPQFSDKTDYVRPNVYDLSLYFHNGYCSDEQVKETYQVTAFYPSWIIEQHWNDAIAVLNDSLNGGYLFSHYQWYREGIKIGVDSSYYYAGEYSELVMGDAYYVGLTRIDDGKTFYSCPIFPSEVVDWDVPTPFIEVLPTYVSKTSPYVFLTSVTSGYYDVRNALGLQVSSGSFNSPTNEMIKLPAVSGIYIIYFNTELDKRSIVKVIVY